MSEVCKKCEGQGWVCESHPETPWCDGLGCCGSVGKPCTCNRVESPWHFVPVKSEDELGK